MMIGGDLDVTSAAGRSVCLAGKDVQAAGSFEAMTCTSCWPISAAMPCTGNADDSICR